MKTLDSTRLNTTRTLENKNTAQQLNTGHQLGHLPRYLDTEMFSPNHGGYTG